MSAISKLSGWGWGCGVATGAVMAALLLGGGTTVSAADAAGPVTLAAQRAVRLSFSSKATERYQLYRSTDAKTWVKEGDVIQGTGSEIQLTFLAANAEKAFFRAETLDGKPVEVVKTLADFKGYSQWKLVRTLLGPDPFLGGAHGGGEVFRDIFVSPSDARRVNGQFPAGTVFLKQLRKNNNGVPGEITDALTVMVKRGGTFSAEGNGWEYFMTDTALNETFMQGGHETMCFSCHVAGKDLDFVFSATALAP